jgi:hypothetical protein
MWRKVGQDGLCARGSVRQSCFQQLSTEERLFDPAYEGGQVASVPGGGPHSIIISISITTSNYFLVSSLAYNMDH